MKSRDVSKFGRLLAKYIVILFAVFYAIFPIYWTVNTAFKGRVELYKYPPSFIPENPAGIITNFNHVLVSGTLRAVLNSLIVVPTATIIGLLIGTLAAYALARFKVGGNFLPFWIFTQRMLPPIVFIIPLFMIFQPLNLINTYQGIILIYAAFSLPYVVWMMRGFFEEVPIEIEEAALIDGCSRLRVFISITLPLAAPGLIATFLFTFLLNWNEFLFALVLLRSKEVFTIPVGQYVFFWGPTSGILWGPACVQALIAIAPIIAMSFYIQKYMIRGLTFGAVKG